MLKVKERKEEKRIQIPLTTLPLGIADPCASGETGEEESRSDAS